MDRASFVGSPHRCHSPYSQYAVCRAQGAHVPGCAPSRLSQGCAVGLQISPWSQAWMPGFARRVIQNGQGAGSCICGHCSGCPEGRRCRHHGSLRPCPWLAWLRLAFLPLCFRRLSFVRGLSGCVCAFAAWRLFLGLSSSTHGNLETTSKPGSLCWGGVRGESPSEASSSLLLDVAP